MTENERLLDVALAALLRHIDTGWEFPDACSKVATVFEIDYDVLRTAYDDQWEQR